MTKIQFSADSWSTAKSANADFDTANTTLSEKITDFGSAVTSEVTTMKQQRENGIVYTDLEDTGTKDDDGNTIYRTWYYYKNSNGKISGEKSLYENTAKNSYQGKIDRKIASYNSEANGASELANNFYTKSNGLYDKLNTLFTALNTAVNTFEGTSVSLADAIASLEESYGNVIGLSIDIDEVKGIEVINYTYTNQKGEKVTITLAEAVNAFYTYVGSATSGMITNELILENMKGLTDEQKANYRLRAMVKTGAYVDYLTGSGLMNFASDESIKGFYQSFVANDKNLNEDMDTQFNSVITSYGFTPNDFGKMLGEDTNSSGLALGGAAMAMALSNEYSFFEKGDDGKVIKDAEGNIKLSEVTEDDIARNKTILENSKENQKKIDENIDEFKKKKEEVKAEEEAKEKEAELAELSDKEKLDAGDTENPDQENTGTDNADTGTGDGNYGGTGDGNYGGTGDGNYGGTGDGNNGGGSGDGSSDSGGETTEPPINTATDDEINAIEDSIDDIEDIDHPEEIQTEERTSADIDAEARDQWFNDNKDLASKREELITEYDNMSVDEKAEALVGLGFSAEVARNFANDNSNGLTAYMVGKQNQELAGLSNTIAKNEGITNHDTRFDDLNTQNYVESKQANVDLTPNSEKLQNARNELNVAKKDYDASVTTANKAIDKANESKERYDKVLSKIQKKNGDDPENWTDDQIEDYNEAANEYNKAVKEANKAYEEAQKQKSAYETEKAEYEEAYGEWKEEAEKAFNNENTEVPNDPQPEDGGNNNTGENTDDSDITTDGGNVNIGIDDGSANNPQFGPDGKPIMGGNVPDPDTDGITYE